MARANPDRKLALETGRKFYVSPTPCKKCGGQIKFVSSHGCHYCGMKAGREKLKAGALDKYKTPEKEAARRDRWRKNNKEKYADQWLRSCIKRLDLTETFTAEDYWSMVEKQEGVCSVCEQECPKGRLAIDHDHKTGKVRGLLCRNCNLGLGYFQDNTRFLEQAVLYLKQHSSDNAPQEEE